MKTPPLKRWVPYLAALACIAGFVRLGFWQLDRAQEKADLLGGFDASENATVEAVDVAGLSAQSSYSTVSLTGTFDTRSVLLDNQVRDGRQGVHVFTPLVPSDGKGAVLVNRGWLPMDAARRELPAFETPIGRHQVVGLTSNPPRPGIQLGDAALGEHWPQLVTYLNLPNLSQSLDLNLSEKIILLAPDSPHGFQRQWRPQVMSPDKHRGYAFQWFALALTVTIVTVALTARRNR